MPAAGVSGRPRTNGGLKASRGLLPPRRVPGPMGLPARSPGASCPGLCLPVILPKPESHISCPFTSSPVPMGKAQILSLAYKALNPRASARPVPPPAPPWPSPWMCLRAAMSLHRPASAPSSSAPELA